jgi:multidrug efflux pump subunit AcrA (membrane-fusion protein)
MLNFLERTVGLCRASFVTLMVLAGGCGGAEAASQPSPLPAVMAVVAQRGAITPSLAIAGVIAPYRQVGIGADLSEPIVTVNVQEGDHVRAGQVLARLLTDDLEASLASADRVVAEDVARYDQASYQTGAVNAEDAAAISAAQATLRAADANLSGARRDLRRYVALQVQGYISNQNVDEQRTTVASDADAVLSGRANLYQAIANANANGTGANAGEQQQELVAAREAANAAEASAEQLRREISRATIVAPVDGIIDAVNANPGEYPSGRQLFTEEQVNQVYAILPSSTSQALDIRDGAPATVIASGSTLKNHGKVAAVLDQVEPGTTNFTVKVLLVNADHHLRAGMPVSASIAEPAVSGTLVPLAAFVDDTRSAVYVIADGVVRTQAVTELNDDGKNAVVTGLTAGSFVVKDVSAATVGNGDKVSVATPAPSGSPAGIPSTNP